MLTGYRLVTLNVKVTSTNLELELRART